MDINGHKPAIFHTYVSLPECNPIQLYGDTRLSEGLMLGESINTMWTRQVCSIHRGKWVILRVKRCLLRTWPDAWAAQALKGDFLANIMEESMHIH